MAIGVPDLIFLVFGGVLALLQLVAACLAPMRWRGAADLLQAARRRISFLTRHFGGCVRSQGPFDTLSEDVGNLVIEWHVRFARSFCGWASLPSWLVLMRCMIKTCLEVEGDETLGFRVCTLVCVALLVFVTSMPSKIHERSLDRFCAVWMLLIIFLLWACPTTLLVAIDSALALIRMFVGMMSHDLRLMLLWNVMYVVCAVFKYTFDSPGGIVRPASYLTDVFTTTCLVIGLVLFRELLIRQAQLIVAARDDCSAANALLNAMSDAVVELKEDLTIVGSAPQLACLVLQDSRRSLDGKAFARFAASDRDEAAFLENMAIDEKAVETTIAKVFHMKLLDCCRASIPVEIFHICFLQRDGRLGMKQRHLLGVREFGDEPRKKEQVHGLPAAACSTFNPRVSTDQSDSCELNGLDCEDSSSQARGRHVLDSMPGLPHYPGSEGDARREALTVVFDTTSASILDLQAGIPPRPHPFLHEVKIWDMLTTAKDLAQSVQSMCLDLLLHHAGLNMLTFEFADEIREIHDPPGEQSRCQALVSVSLRRAAARTSTKILGVATLRPIVGLRSGASPLRSSASLDGGSVGSSSTSSSVDRSSCSGMKHLTSL